MTRWLVGTSVKFRLLVLPVALALMVIGVVKVQGAPVDVLPEFSPPYVEIQTEALGLSAPEVEQLITVPLEGDLLNGVAGIDVIRSESVPGLSSIVLVFEPGTNLLDARQLVQERLVQAHALPNVSKPPAMLQPLSSASRVTMVGLSSERLTPTELGLLARWTIRPRLLGVPGVANVVIWGQREHQLQVRVDPKRLHDQGVSLSQVISTTGNAQLVSPLSFLPASTPGTGGFIDTPNQRLSVRHVLPIAKPEGLAQVPVEGTRRLRLGDVTDIVEDHQPLIGDALIGGAPGLMLVVEKFPGANTLKVTRDVEAALDSLRPGLSGVRVDAPVFRPATFVETALDNLAIALVAAALLLALVLGAFLFDWRVAFVALVSVSASLVGALLVLALRGETLNALVLAGLLLAAGVVVDEAVIGIENVRRRVRERHGAGRGAGAEPTIVEAFGEIRGPTAFATAILLVAIAPLMFLEGRPGSFFEPLAVSYALAVLASMLVALTLSPALAVLVLRRGPEARRDPWAARWVGRGARAVVSRIVRSPSPAFVAAGALAVLGLAVLPRLDLAVLPSFKESNLLVNLDAAPGTSRPAMNRMSEQLAKELRSIPGVRNVGGHVGRAVMSDHVGGIESAALWLDVDPDADHGAAVAAARRIVDGYPGVRGDVTTYSDERLRQVGGLASGENAPAGRDGALSVLTGASDPVAVRLYGKDLEVLRAKAEEVRGKLATIDGVVAPRVEAHPAQPTVEIEVDLAAARRHGIKPGDVRRAAATLVQGIEVGALFEEQKVFEVLVVGTPDARHSLGSIRDLLIDTPGGGQVAVGDVADVRIAPTPSSIKREAASRRIDIVADVRGRDLDAVLADVEDGLAGIRFPLEYYTQVLGGSATDEAAWGRVVGASVAALLAMLLLLQAAFGAWRLAAAYLVLLPIALVGGLVAAALAGGTVGLGALVGLGAIVALAARNGALVVGRIQHIQGAANGGKASAIQRGAEDRAVPILLSAVALAAVLLPFAVAGGAAGLEIAHPMAIVVLGGLVTSTVLNLVVLPALYLRLGPRLEPGRVVESAAPVGQVGLATGSYMHEEA